MSISSRDQKKVEKAFREAMEAGDGQAEQLVEALGACPDARKALPLALEALFGDDPKLSAAAARGLAKNADPKVLFALAKQPPGEDQERHRQHQMDRSAQGDAGEERHQPGGEQAKGDGGAGQVSRSRLLKPPCSQTRHAPAYHALPGRSLSLGQLAGRMGRWTPRSAHRLERASNPR